jgi:predicted lipid-binding transport protein (Tim44 family)
MKTRLVTISLALMLTLTGLQAEAAKRLGGGGSVGRQSSNVTQREAARPAPATPATPAAQPAPAPASSPAAQAQRKPWGAMLGGLAAGLGLAWLAHSLGMGEAFGQALMFGLLALLIMGAVTYFLRRRNAVPGASPYALQGAGPATAPTPPQYNPQNVGNDASARPWEGPAQFEAAAPSRASTRIGSGLIGGGQNWSIPADFDVVSFETSAKANFVSLQDAWDRSDLVALRAMMTDEMLGEIRQQLAERDAQSGGHPNKTEVVKIEAHLLGIEDLGSGFMASVEFSGLVREDVASGPSPFREVWNMTRTKTEGDGWLVAGVQALQ